VALDVHTPVAIVGEANDVGGLHDGAARSWRHIEGRGQRLGQRRAEILERQGRSVDGMPSVQRQWVFFAELKGPVADQLGIDAAIARVVDVLLPMLVSYSITFRMISGAQACLVDEAILVAARGIAARGFDSDIDG